jgi:hypothetical protein
MANDILCNIGYMGGTHGTFLTYFLDKFSRHTPDIEGQTFDKKSGTAHSKSRKYSGKFTYKTYEDEQGNWRNDLNWNQNSVIILLDKESLLTFCRLSFLRDGDYHLQPTQVKKVNEEEYSVNQTFKDFFKNDFKSIYNIDLNDENCPNILLRDYLKIMFLNDHKNHWLLTTEKVKKNLNEKTLTLNLSDIYNTEKFLNRMKQISDKLNLDLDLSEEAKAKHQEFLSALFIDSKTLDRANKVTENIKENNDINIDCGNLDVVEESYIFAWIEKNYDFIQCPLRDSFFKNTSEIKRYIKHYPNHYKAMNPNLPKFNGIDNPYYLHKNEK